MCFRANLAGTDLVGEAATLPTRCTALTGGVIARIKQASGKPIFSVKGG